MAVKDLSDVVTVVDAVDPALAEVDYTLDSWSAKEKGGVRTITIVATKELEAPQARLPVNGGGASVEGGPVGLGDEE